MCEGMIDSIMVIAFSLLPWVIAYYLLFKPLMRKAQELWEVPIRLRELESQTKSLEEMLLRMHHQMKEENKPKDE